MFVILSMPGNRDVEMKAPGVCDFTKEMDIPVDSIQACKIKYTFYERALVTCYVIYHYRHCYMQ